MEEEQEQGVEWVAPGLFKQANFIDDGEEIREFSMAQIDDFRNVGGFDEAVEKPDLTARILDARNGDMTRQVVRQSRRLIGKVERRDGARVRHVVLGEKPRQHGLVFLKQKTAYDIEGRRHAPAGFR